MIFSSQHDYIRIVSRFSDFLGRSLASATAEDIRRFQLEQREAGMPAPAMNSHVAALRFFFTTTLDRPDLSRKLIRVPYPRKLPTVLSPDAAAAVRREISHNSKGGINSGGKVYH